MKRTGQQLTAQLIELRNAIKRKYKLFKEGTVESDIMLEKQYKPIIQELRKTVTPKTELKEEAMDYPDSEEEFKPDTIEPGDFTPMISTPRGRESLSQYIETHSTHPLTKRYLQGLMKDKSTDPQFDTDYGPRFQADTLMVGDSAVTFDEDGTIIVNDNEYKATEGLYELLFKRVPNKAMYNAKDLATYKSILLDTNAHKENYKHYGKVKRTKLIKYTKLLRDLFPLPKGKGMIWKKVKSRDIVHWDDVNELVARLQHIAVSTETGNRVHTNEIIGIVEELREAGFIKGWGNSRFRALLR